MGRLKVSCPIESLLQWAWICQVPNQNGDRVGGIIDPQRRCNTGLAPYLINRGKHHCPFIRNQGLRIEIDS